MRVRNKLDGNTFIAELDLRRVDGRHSGFVLVLHDGLGGTKAMGPLAASLGCQLVESSPEEWAALLLAGFQLPGAQATPSPLPRLNSLLRQTKPQSRNKPRMNAQLRRAVFKQRNGGAPSRRKSTTSSFASPKNHFLAKRDHQHDSGFAPPAVRQSAGKWEESSNPDG